MRSLGTTSLRVSPVGLGLAALGRPAYINLGHGEDLGDERSVKAMETRTHRVLDRAWRLGVRYFDAARSYGLAEQFLASWLAERKLPPEQVTVGSKWGYKYTAGWRLDVDKHEVKEHNLALLRSQWHESREYLGDWLRLYQIHSVTPESKVLENQEVLEALARLKEEGMSIGLSTSGPRQPEVIARAVAVEVDGVPLFDSVQATWNLLETSVGAVLQEVHSHGVGVILKEVLANGRLTARNGEPALHDSMNALSEQAQRLNSTIDALAIAAACVQPWADVVLSGATTEEQLDSNLRALELTSKVLSDELVGPFAEAPSEYWRHRAKLPWN